jgi:hypothetical protein
MWPKSNRTHLHSACDLVGTLETACLGLFPPNSADILRFGGLAAVGTLGALVATLGNETTFVLLIAADFIAPPSTSVLA